MRISTQFLIFIMVLLGSFPLYAATFEDYGAVGNGTTDDTTAIQSALNAEDDIDILAKTYRITAPVTISHVINLSGVDHSHSIIFGDFSSGTCTGGALKIDLGNTGYLRSGGILQNFAVVAPCPNIYIDTSSGMANYLGRWRFDGMALANTNATQGYSFVLNNPTNVDGFFSSHISNSVFNGGLSLPRLGDSVTIDNNTFYGSTIAINVTAVQGASHVVIRENNFSTNGQYGILAGDYMQNTKIENNTFEVFSGSSDYMILFWGPGIINPTVRGNNFNGHNHIAGSVIGMGAPSGQTLTGGLLDENYSISGCNSGIFLTSTTTGVRIGKRNKNTCTTALTNQSTTNIVE